MCSLGSTEDNYISRLYSLDSTEDDYKSSLDSSL